jgi:hypothetical protein
MKIVITAALAAFLIFGCQSDSDRAKSLIKKYDTQIDEYLVYYSSALDNISQAIALLDNPMATSEEQVLADLKSRQADVEITIGQQLKTDILNQLLDEGKKIAVAETLIEEAFSVYVKERTASAAVMD